MTLRTIQTVFISYAREDQAFARAVGRRLDVQWRERSIAVSADWTLAPGVEYPPQLAALIQQAIAFVFVLSPHSATSRACQFELTQAVKERKRIVPVLVSPVPRDDDVPAPLREIQWVLAQEAEPAADEVARIVATNVELLAEHAALLVAANAWASGRGPLLARRELAAADRLLLRLFWTGSEWPQATELQERFVRESRAASARSLAAALGGTAVALAVTALATFAAYQERELRRIESGNRLAMASEFESRGAPERVLRSAELALAALEISRTPESDSALRAALSLLPRRRAVLQEHGLFDGVTFSASGRYVGAVVGGGGKAPELRVWRSSDWRPALALPLGRSRAFAFVGAGEVVATASDAGELLLTDIAQPQRVRTAPTLAAADRIVVSADGETVAVACQKADGSVVAIHRGADGQRRAPDWAVPGLLMDVAFSPSGQRLVAATNSGYLGVRAIAGGKTEYEETGRGAVLSAAFALEDCLVTSSGIRALQKDVPCFLPERETLRFSPRRTFALMGKLEGGAALCRMSNGEPLELPSDCHELEPSTWATFSDDDRVLALGSPRSVRLFDTARPGAERARVVYDGASISYEAARPPPIAHAALSPDGSAVVAAIQHAADAADNEENYALVAYDTVGARPVLTLVDDVANARELAVSNDEGWVALGVGKRALAGEIATGRVFEMPVQDGRIETLAFASDMPGRQCQPCLVFATDRSIGIWNVTRDTPSPVVPFDGAVLSLAVSRRGAIAVGTATTGAWLWSGNETERPTRLAVPGPDRVDKVMFDDAGGALLRVGQRGTDRIDLVTLETMDLMPGYRSDVVASSRLDLIASADDDGGVLLRRPPRDAVSLGQPMSNKAASRLALSVDGRLLAAAIGNWGGLRGGDTTHGAAVVWRVGATAPYRVFPHPRAVVDVALSGDDRYLATLSLDDEIRIWELEAARAVAAIPLAQGGRTVRFVAADRYIATESGVYRWRVDDMVADATLRLERP